MCFLYFETKSVHTLIKRNFKYTSTFMCLCVCMHALKSVPTIHLLRKNEYLMSMQVDNQLYDIRAGMFSNSLSY